MTPRAETPKLWFILTHAGTCPREEFRSKAFGVNGVWCSALVATGYASEHGASFVGLTALVENRLAARGRRLLRRCDKLWLSPMVTAYTG